MFTRPHRDFIEQTLSNLAGAMEYAAHAESTGCSSGLLQRIDPRVKLAGLLLLIMAAVASHRSGVTACIFSLGAILACASGGAVLRMTAKLWSGVLLFTGAIMLPAIFTIPGNPLWRLPLLGWTVTEPGLRCGLNLVGRAGTTATLAALLVLTTPWTHLLKALCTFRVPTVCVAVLGMTHRYIFLLLQVAREAFEARRARSIGPLSVAQRRQMAASGAGALLSRSIQLSGETYEAMLARGFCGSARSLDEFNMKSLDWLALAAFGTAAGTAFWLGA